MSDPQCLICGNAAAAALAYPHPKSELFEGLEVCLCRSCGMGWVDRQLDPARLHAYYAEDYAQHAKRVQRPGPEAYFGAPEQMFKPQRSRAQLRLAQERLARPPRRLLDFGAGFGTTLYLARKEFRPETTLVAVEPDLSMKPYLEFIAAEIVENLDQVATASCDLIIASHVIEHYQSAEVEEVLQKLRACLAPDGLLVAEVPNSDFQAYPDIAGHSHEPHLLFFSQKAFAALFTAAGFSVPCVSTTGSQRRHGALADLTGKVLRRLKGKSEYGNHRSAIRLAAHINAG